jgi:hypothetical protein
MRNLDNSKNLLVQAMRAMGDDYTLAEARQMIRMALAHIDKVDAKRGKRKNSAPEPGWKLDPVGGSLMMVSDKHNPGSLEVIEKMIQAEQAKLESKGGDDEVGTILG